MTDDETLNELHEELARQDEELAQARQAMEAFAGHSIEVPDEWLRALEEACVPPAVVPAALVRGMRV